jgi:hypothetical protein
MCCRGKTLSAADAYAVGRSFGSVARGIRRGRLAVKSSVPAVSRRGAGRGTGRLRPQDSAGRPRPFAVLYFTSHAVGVGGGVTGIHDDCTNEELEPES